VTDPTGAKLQRQRRSIFDAFLHHREFVTDPAGAKLQRQQSSIFCSKFMVVFDCPPQLATPQSLADTQIDAYVWLAARIWLPQLFAGVFHATA